MTEPIKEKAVLISKVAAKFLTLLLATLFVLYHSQEFFGIGSTGSFFDRILLVPPLVFILRAGIVIFLAIAFGFLVTILFRDIEGLKVGGLEIRLSNKALMNAKAKISELVQANSKLRKEFEVLKLERDSLRKTLSQIRKMRGDKNES